MQHGKEPRKKEGTAEMREGISKSKKKKKRKKDKYRERKEESSIRTQ